MNLDFWKNKKVLITGHTGFKGSWLCLWLQELGADLYGYSLQPPSTPNLFEEAGVANGMQNYTGDIRDFHKLERIFQSIQPEIVIHMAAQSLVRVSYSSPVDTYSVNMMGVVNLLECVRNTPSVKVALNITTDKCYENKEWVWGYRENDQLGGYDPYSNSKACSELITAGYRSSFFNNEKYNEHGVAIATARAGNVIGGGDWSTDRLIPDVIRSIELGNQIVIRNPSSIRPWQHVLDPLHGYLCLSQKLYDYGPSFAEPWNFGPNHSDCRTVKWIVERLIKIWGNSSTWISSDELNHHESQILKLDISKSREKLDWCASLNLEDSLELVVDWYKKRSQGVNIRDLTLNQIINYQSNLNY